MFKTIKKCGSFSSLTFIKIEANKGKYVVKFAQKFNPKNLTTLTFRHGRIHHKKSNKYGHFSMLYQISSPQLSPNFDSCL